MKVFNKEFLLGAATASYQIEGAYNEDGKGLCNWDTFCRVPGNVERGDTGNVACDHYHKVDEDVELMAAMHLDCYRFSISWSRILPKGTGKVNEAGIAFYNHLIDKLIEKGITPMATLFHWDLPEALEEKGGFCNPESVEWYLEYAKLVFERFGDRVKYFITFNEPFVYTHFGYVYGTFPPGIKGRIDLKILSGHHILLSHGKAVQLYRKMNLGGKIGITLDYCINLPVNEKDPKDVRAAFEANQFWPGWYYEPVVLGHYPELAEKYYREQGLLPEIGPDDMKIISEKIDFLGINAYFSNYVTWDDTNTIHHSRVEQLKFDKTDMYWDITPDGFYKLGLYLRDTATMPIIITENGCAYNDVVTPDNKCHDPKRIEYVETYLGQLQKAMDDGLNCIGYCYWSLMDNFEWATGYRGRFGMIHIDYDTLVRTPKDSSMWYRDIIDAKNNQ